MELQLRWLQFYGARATLSWVPILTTAVVAPQAALSPLQSSPQKSVV